MIRPGYNVCGVRDMTKKKELMVGDIVEWHNLEMLAKQRVHLLWSSQGKKEKFDDAVVKVVRLIESTGRTFDEAMEIGNEIHSGYINTIDDDGIHLQKFKDDEPRFPWSISRIILPATEMVKVTNKVSQ